jgi:hypothetical protein
MWQKRCLVIAPVLAFVMTALLLSCGSSSNPSTPIATATPITLVLMRICAQTPSTTSECAQVTTAKIALQGTHTFYAQGQFSSNGVITFQDVSASAGWFVNNSLLTSNGQGSFTAGGTVGCTCVTAASGTVVSPPTLVGVGQPASACSPCPASPP